MSLNLATIYGKISIYELSNKIGAIKALTCFTTLGVKRVLEMSEDEEILLGINYKRIKVRVIRSLR